ncbi:MAG TPA: hypothetical protein HPP94_16765 [Desulfuromonadales bacterium]|nr:hypothetical protein [Desulfuromonadales bacterium]
MSVPDRFLPIIEGTLSDRDATQLSLDGIPLIKTEKEYYSRAVKKKVAALANAELHRQARMLLEL